MQLVLLDKMTLGDFDETLFAQFGEFKSYQTTDSTQVLERTKDADIIITNKVVLDSEYLVFFTKVKAYLRECNRHK